jgi:HTH-type transcriptional regulator/antitoxin HipB
MRVTAPIDLGLAVRKQRRALGMDQRALANAVGTNRQWVIDLEKGRPGASLGLVLRALSVLRLGMRVGPDEPAPSFIDIDAVIARSRGEP